MGSLRFSDFGDSPSMLLPPPNIHSFYASAHSHYIPHYHHLKPIMQSNHPQPPAESGPLRKRPDDESPDRSISPATVLPYQPSTLSHNNPTHQQSQPNMQANPPAPSTDSILSAGPSKKRSRGESHGNDAALSTPKIPRMAVDSMQPEARIFDDPANGKPVSRSNPNEDMALDDPASGAGAALDSGQLAESDDQDVDMAVETTANNSPVSPPEQALAVEEPSPEQGSMPKAAQFFDWQDSSTRYDR
ncbi:MAG: hypothetical protein Q9166_007229 [cf. Caloplaca sp. 2 TL-2023]